MKVEILKSKCIGAVTYTSVGREGLRFIPYDTPTHIWRKES